MPSGDTYIKLDSRTLSSSTSTITFSNIPQIYTDLVLTISGTVVGNGQIFLTFNGVSTGYSDTVVYGTGSSSASFRRTNNSRIQDIIIYTTQSDAIINVMNYSNSTTHKTVLSRSNVPGSEVDAMVGLWANTAPINTITMTHSGGNFNSGCTFTLYGIAASSTPKASGGTITTNGTYWIHTFTSSGSFVTSDAIDNLEYLVIAGGGGGTAYSGGGAGGYRSSVIGELSGGNSVAESVLSVPKSSTYVVTVGAGGIWNSGKGGDSRFGPIIANAGGAPGDRNGGSGGGGTASGSGGTAISGQGNSGGNGGSTSGGGGGGASAAGSNGSGGSAGKGGDGLSSSINGIATTRAGGGGGSGSSSSGAGGSGGGGAGNSTSPTSGTSNTGGGGGGNYAGPGTSNGGSGIVIVRYPR